MIIFEKVRYKNLLSTGNKFTEININEYQTTLIVGDNGAGKSTILDALCFGLYGKGFRNIKKEQLVNSINGREMVVEVEFSIGKRQYKVHRSVKPNKFEIYVDDVKLDQEANVRDTQEYLEKHILKMSYRSFTQVAILGSANFVPFMQLRAKERRGLVEDLLDISIFSTMADMLKKRIQNHLIEIKDTEHNIDLVEERISGLNNQLSTLNDDREKKIAKFQSSIQESKTYIDGLILKGTQNVKEVEEKQELITDKDPVGDKLKQALEHEKTLTTKRKAVQRELKFYQDNDVCPTCKQDLDEEHKTTHIDERNTKIEELEVALSQIDTIVTETNTRLEEIQDVQKEIDSIQKKTNLLQSEIISNQKYIKKLEGEITELQTDVSVTTGTQELIEAEEDNLDTLLAKKENLSNKGHYYDIAKLLLRDQGIKERIIKQYVPIMNKMINKYLAQLEFYVGFELDESFEETIKSRHRDVFKYDNFSQGEKMRIDLSLLFTWRGIARMKNSVNTNLLILDEVFDSSLDSGGTDEFLKLLGSLTEKTNAFIISHKGDVLFDKFENVLRFEKHKNFSRIAE
jgi:DNA repair exonuclease SbcCD ATPase subunit